MDSKLPVILPYSTSLSSCQYILTFLSRHIYAARYPREGEHPRAFAPSKIRYSGWHATWHACPPLRACFLCSHHVPSHSIIVLGFWATCPGHFRLNKIYIRRYIQEEAKVSCKRAAWSHAEKLGDSFSENGHISDFPCIKGKISIRLKVKAMYEAELCNSFFLFFWT